jgi:hypothetical protein
MNEIIPFTKELYFKTMIKEITSISLDHTINLKENNSISGEFIISGTYKMTEASTLEEEFSFSIPISIEIDDKYDISDAKILIDDFNYEIVNEESLKVNIDLLIDGLEVITHEEFSTDSEVIKKHLDKANLLSELEDESRENISKSEIKTQELIRDDSKIIDDKEDVNIMELFNNINNNQKETYATYSIYFFKEDDTIEKIIEKYSVGRDELANYNKLEDIKVGSKIVIPCQKLNEKS